jgi:hypothetical protein
LSAFILQHADVRDVDASIPRTYYALPSYNMRMFGMFRGLYLTLNSEVHVEVGRR